MKILTKTALAALLAGSIGSVALMPAFADDTAAPAATTSTITPAPAEQLARANDMGGPGMNAARPARRHGPARRPARQPA